MPIFESTPPRFRLLLDEDAAGREQPLASKSRQSPFIFRRVARPLMTVSLKVMEKSRLSFSRVRLAAS